MKKILYALPFLAFLATCAPEAPPRVTQDFGQVSKINLDVQTIAFADRSGLQPTSSPYTMNNFKPTIAEAVRQWAADNLQAVGAAGSGQASVIIKDASLTSQAIPHANDWFTREQTTKFIGHVEVEIDANGHDGFALASAQSTHFATLPEHPSEIEKQNAYTTVLNALMHDLQQNLQAAIQEHMNRFVITAPMMDSSK